MIVLQIDLNQLRLAEASSSSEGSVGSDRYSSILSELDERMAGVGLKPHAGRAEGADRTYHKRAFVLSKFGLADTFISVSFGDALSQEQFVSIGEAAFSYALAHKNFLPRGFFGYVESFPLVVTDQASEALIQYISESHCPKHWAAGDFAVLLDLATGKLHMYQKTPAWGGAYYAGFRKKAHTLFDGLGG